eukprot:3469808-Pyramimonas_sp.AAC.1
MAPGPRACSATSAGNPAAPRDIGWRPTPRESWISRWALRPDEPWATVIQDYREIETSRPFCPGAPIEAVQPRHPPALPTHLAATYTPGAGRGSRARTPCARAHQCACT